MLVTIAKFSEDQLMDAIEKYFSKIVGDLDEFLEVLTDFEESIEEEEAKIEEEEANFEEEEFMIEEEEPRIEEEQAMIEAEEEMRMRERFLPLKPKQGFCEEKMDCFPYGLCNMEEQRCECFDGFEGPYCKRKVRKTPLVARRFGEPNSSTEFA